MTEKSEDSNSEDSPATPREALRLSWLVRTVLLVFGTGLGAASVLAVFMKGLGAAIVAFVVVALVMLLLGLVGYVPQRVWGKDMGLELGYISQRVTDVIVDAVAPERREELMEAIDAASERQHALRRRRANSSRIWIHQLEKFTFTILPAKG